MIWEDPYNVISFPFLSIKGREKKQGKKSLLEAAQLAAMDLDAVRVTVLGYLTLVNLVLSGDGECLWAGDSLFNPFCLECLFDLVSVHDY